MRRLAFLTFSFSAAVFIAQYFLSATLSLYLAIGSAVIFIAAFFIKLEKARLANLILLGLALGFLWNYGYDIIFLAPARALNGVTEKITARVSDYPQKTDYGFKLCVKLRLNNAPDIKSMLYIYEIEGLDLKPGDTISLVARAELASEKSEEDYLSPKGVFLLLYSKEKPEFISSNSSSPLYYPIKLAKRLNETAEIIFPGDVYPFMKALLTGTQTDLYKDSYLISALSNTGAAHVVAVSGMHLLYLVGLIQFILGKNKKTAFICIPLILFYMAMTGNTPSILRAGIMQIMLLAAPLLFREYDSITALGFSLFVLLLINPLSIKHTGLQLSFASVLGIILFSEKLRSYISNYVTGLKSFQNLLKYKHINSLIRAIISAFAVTFSAMLFVIPITAAAFGNISLIAPVTNLLVLPVITLVFTAGVIVTSIGALILPIGIFLSPIVTIPVRYIIWVLKQLDGLPFAALYSRSFFISLWLIFFYALVAVIIFSAKLKKKSLWLAVPSALMLAIAIGFTYLDAVNGSLKIAALDVGQGQSIVVTSEKNALMIDCGGNNMKNAGDNASEYLISIGRRKLDALILTHFHSDHVNGVIQLLHRIKVKALIAPDIPGLNDEKEEILKTAYEQGIEVILIDSNTEVLTLGKLSISIYPPLGSGEDNELGLCVRVSVNDFDMLITGDVDSETELRFLEYTNIQELELLIAGHHGSKNSTSQYFLNKLKPDIAIISSGYNKYGHPSEETLLRLIEAGTIIYRTDQCGEIILSID